MTKLTSKVASMQPLNTGSVQVLLKQNTVDSEGYHSTRIMSTFIDDDLIIAESVTPNSVLEFKDPSLFEITNESSGRKYLNLEFSAFKNVKPAPVVSTSFK